MSNQNQPNVGFLPEWTQALRRKYNQMSVLQLKKQKILMVKDLQQINLLLDEMITDQVQQSARYVYDYDKQIERTRKLHKSLLKSLINFEFMLTGDYSVKVIEQITRLNSQIKNLRQQVNKFNRMLSVPMQKDIQICQELQKQVFSLQKELEDLKIKNIKKKQSMTSHNQQAQKKIVGIKKLSKQIQKLKQQIESEGITNDQSSPQNNRSYQDMLIKKEKILNLIDRDQKRFGYEYKAKIKKYKQLEQTSYQIELYLHQIEEKLQEKGQELKMTRGKSKQLKSKDKISSNSFRTKKVKTQQNSQADSFFKRQKYSQNYSYLKNQINSENNQAPNSKRQSIYTDAQQKSIQLLPKLYKALGKSKLRIQQDCNVKDLIY